MADTPLGGLLASINQKALSGSVVIAETPERLHCISLRDGCPSKVRLADPVDLIGDIMVEVGAVPGDQLAEVLVYAGSAGVLTGLAAMQLGFARQQDIVEALTLQVQRRVVRLFAVSSGTYGFYQEDFLAGFGGSDAPSIDPLAVIAVGARESYDLARLNALVAGMQDSGLCLSVRTDDVSRLCFTDDEASVVSALGTPQPLASLVQSSGLPPFTVYTVVHCLHMTGSLGIDRGAAPAPEPGSPRPSTAPPRTVEPTAPAPSRELIDAEKSARRAEAEELIAKGDEANYFELLGVPPEASDKEIQRAYVERARQFHPDRATGEMADLKFELAELFSRISVAHQTLKDTKKRLDYLDLLRATQAGTLAPRESEEDVVRRYLEADESFFKAQILTKRNKLDEAEELVRKAVKVNPEQGDYLALLTWIESRKRPRGEQVIDLIETLQKATQLAPNSENAHYYLAQLCYQDGRTKNALMEYETVMRLNQYNVDAVRMVRLLRKKGLEVAEEPKQSRLASSRRFLNQLLGGDAFKKKK
jgi:tetratricopeptide (TPR) repeat protein